MVTLSVTIIIYIPKVCKKSSGGCVHACMHDCGFEYMCVVCMHACVCACVHVCLCACVCAWKA